MSPTLSNGQPEPVFCGYCGRTLVERNSSASEMLFLTCPRTLGWWWRRDYEKPHTNVITQRRYASRFDVLSGEKL